jgi:cellulose synthase/poly-beta-1,6-N-acetylglucosamine synthase-like glycosyltransferase
MCLRLQQHHKKVTNEPNAIVYTTAPRTFLQLYKQRVRWTYGFIKNAIDYYRMFLNPRYGTLGMFVLPISIISLFSAIFLFSILIWNTLVLVTQEFVRFQTVGIAAASVPQFDVFYVNTSTIFTVTVLLILLTLVLIGLGKRLGKDPVVSFDIPVYLVLYGFVTPLWLTGALYKAVIRRGVRWR